MKNKVVIAAVMVGLAVAGAAVFRSSNRADAAPGDCYSAATGPSEPTICK